MRIIAGKLGGRSFVSPRSQRTHPMSDKIRNALFNALGDIEDLSVLDAFAGSGALSFEAVSRGAVSALAIDNDKPAQQAIQSSIDTLELDASVKLIKASSSSWSDNNPDQLFDIVLADPPYDDIQRPVLNKLVRHVRPGGLLVVSWPGSEPVPAFDGLEQVSNKRYGDAQLLFFRCQS